MLAVLAVLACSGALAGCGGSSAASRVAEQQQANLVDIKAKVKALPQVTTVETVYGDEPAGSLLVTAIVRPVADKRLHALVSDIERIAWQSRLNPLLSMRVVVQDTRYRQELVVYTLQRDPTWRRLQTQYGHRPVSGP